MSERTLYTATATVSGARAEGRGATSDGQLEVDLRLPAEMGGQGGGTNPEQLFAVGYAACFESAVGVVGRRAGVETEGTTVESRVNLHPTPEKGFKLSVELDVDIPGADAEKVKEIVRTAHQVCPYSAATRGNIDVTLTANGEPV